MKSNEENDDIDDQYNTSTPPNTMMKLMITGLKKELNIIIMMTCNKKYDQ